jgi:hypothetical protein
MRLRKYSLPFATIFMIMLFFSCTYNPAEYYPLNEGDQRTYLYTVDIVGGPNDGMHISIPIESFVFGKEVVNGMQTIKMGGVPPNDDYFCWRMDLQGLKLCKLYLSMTKRYRIFEPPLVTFPSIFNVGDVYERSSSVSIHSDDDDIVVERLAGDTTLTFKSVEDVTVPAGTFEDCPKISLLGNYDKESGGTYESFYTTWYAKGVGMVKEIMITKSSYLVGEDVETTVTFELIRATVDGITHE